MILNRKPLTLEIGEIVACDDSHYTIVEHLDFDSIIGKNVETGRAEVLSIKKLRSVKKDPVINVDIESIADKDWKRAQKRYAAIKPLIKNGYSRDDVIKRSEEVGVSFPTLYRWIKKYNNAGSFSGLLTRKPGVKKGTTKLSFEVEQILRKAIEDIYLTKQREPVQKVIQEVFRQCKKQGLPDRP